MTGPSIVLVIASVLALWHPCPVTAREGFRQSADDRGPVSQSVEARIAGAASSEKAGIPCTAADSQNGEPTAPIIVAVNRATFEELQSLPGIGPGHVRQGGVRAVHRVVSKDDYAAALLSIFASASTIC
jgi:hypothetical protein